jgi:hypothetical protein
LPLNPVLSGPMKTAADRSQTQARSERAILAEFASQAGLALARQSVRSLRPPRPDLSCRLAGVPIYVEVTRLSQQGLNSSLAKAYKTGVSEVLVYDDRAALRQTLARKAERTYAVGTRQLALLVWIDGIYHPEGMQPSWASTILREVGPASRWVHIWVYDQPRQRVVATWTRFRQ